MKKYDNFVHALDNLREIDKYAPPYSIVELTGLVGLFEICFEQAWKAMKEILEQHGYEEEQTGSPKAILKLAYQAHMIEDEDLWLDALMARNNVSHAYNREIALNIVKRAKEDFLPLFEKLKDAMRQNWLS